MFYGLPQQHFHQQPFYARGEEEEEEPSQPPKKRSHFPHSEEEQHTREYVGFGDDKMEETQHRCSRLGLLKGTGGGGGEIVEVQGGHIVRSTGRKDRHSKVCTAKGPRDRRVRLSAHTAIQFYDVQDRLGYDRPSKAVDWLIKKAKSAIDELAELPPWNPTATNVAQPSAADQQVDIQTDSFVGSSSKRPMEVEQDASGYDAFQHQHLNNSHTSNNSGFLPPSLDSDAIADTIKSFFPVAAAATSSTPVHFHNYPPDLLPRSTSHTQDLRLSLQSFQDPILLQHHHPNPTPSSQQSIFSTSSPLHFDSASASASWSDQPHHEMGRFQRMLAWNNAGTDAGSGDGGGGAGFIFTSPQPSLSHNPFFPQRGPLQSSNSPPFRAWTDQSIALMNHSQMQSVNQSSISGFGFASGGFSGFRIPARIQGEEEHDDADKPPPSASRH